MYLDTLKVSTLEQSASQTSARGGLGNPELIVWDFGKEISLSLQDAVFTPASQSLMWGGKYGIKKPQIYGVWNPFVYPKNEEGRQQYIERVNADPSLVHVVPKGWELYFSDFENETAEWNLFTPSYFQDLWAANPLFCPWFFEDLVITNIVAGKVSYQDVEYDGFTMTTSHPSISTEVILYKGDSDRVEMHFTYEDWHTNFRFTNEVNLLSFVCPCDSEKKYFLLFPAAGRYLYDRDGTGLVDQLTMTEYNCPTDNIINESEEISRAVGKYTIRENQLDDKTAWSRKERPEMAILSVDKFGKFNYNAYEFVSSDDPEDTACYYHDVDLCDESLIKCTDERIDAYGYTWTDTSLIMNSLEKTQEIHYIDAADIRYRIRKDNGMREIAVEYTSDNGNNYLPKIDLYKTIKQKYIDDRGFEQEYRVKVLIGSFYIIDDWNLDETVPQDFGYLINTGINNADILESMKIYRAKRTFAIDADKNLRSSNYRLDNKYANKPLTVFYNPRTMLPYEPNSDSYTTVDGIFLEGNFTIIKQGETYYKWTRNVADEYSNLGNQIIVDAEHFPGNFKIVGETYARSRDDGQDQRYQFEIPLCKLAANTSLNLEAAGDPTTFSMNFKVLRKDDGTMVKLTQYNVEQNPVTGVEEIVPSERFADTEIPQWENNEEQTHWVTGGYRAIKGATTIEIINPTNETVQFTDSDEEAPLDGTGEGHITLATDEELETIVVNNPIVYGNTISLPNESLIEGAQEIINTTMTEKLIEKASTNYTIEQETHEETMDGQIVPGTSTWNFVADVVSVVFLRENDVETITVNEEV